MYIHSLHLSVDRHDIVDVDVVGVVGFVGVAGVAIVRRATYAPLFKFICTILCCVGLYGRIREVACIETNSVSKWMYFGRVRRERMEVWNDCELTREQYAKSRICKRWILINTTAGMSVPRLWHHSRSVKGFCLLVPSCVYVKVVTQTENMCLERYVQTIHFRRLNGRPRLRFHRQQIAWRPRWLQG
jgi:hypothetical protein